MTKKIEIAIADEIFASAPGYRRGIVVSHSIKNGPSPKALVELMRAEEVRMRNLINLKDLRLIAWQEAFKAVGIKPNKFRPSVDALIRRVLNGGSLPSISTVVDISTILSLRYALPCGAHSLDDVHQSLKLRRASGLEQFTPFGLEERVAVSPGEIIYTDGDEVATSKWAWRQANHTIIRPGTTSFELNIDALNVISDSDLEKVITDAQKLISEFLGVESVSHILNQASPSIKVPKE